jgi:hypothetical protein
MVLTALIGPQVERIAKIDVGQQRRDHSSLRSTRFGWHKVSIFHDAGLQPLANQAEDATITDTVLDETDQPLMADRVEESGYVGVHYPVRLRRGDPDCQRVQRIVLSASGPEPIRKPQEVYFVDGIEHLHDGALNDLVLQRGDAQRTLSSIRFCNISSPRWERSIRASMHLLAQSN